MPHVPPSSEQNQPEPNGSGPKRIVPGRELVAVFLMLVLADVAIYRGQGFSGWAAFVLASPGLLALGASKRPRSLALAIVGGMLLLVAVKLVWAGTGLLVGLGVALLAAFAMALAGFPPYVLDVAAYALQTLRAGWLGLNDYFESIRQSPWVIPRSTCLKVGLPFAAFLGFGTVFILANPDVARVVGQRLEEFGRLLSDSFSRFAPRWTELYFWFAMAWLTAGLLRPVMSRSVLARWGRPPGEEAGPADEPRHSPLYPAYANTLLTVIGLFAVYLVFEFQTLWLRVFPPGFHYSGYAHEGAAWLTVALAMATFTLSVMFRANVLRDPRSPRLRRLAWIWSVENLLLAAAVYHRLLIYVGFNGMTRMRTIGFLGISAVVVGFVLVVRKITARHDLVWLVRRQLWVLAVAVFLYAVMPVDALVHRYNVRRILAGDPAPSVQISVHPIDAGGTLELIPLLESENAILREGIRALLAERALELERLAQQREIAGWSSFQLADHVLLKQLQRLKDVLEVYTITESRQAALHQFHDYAYQWY